MQRKINTLKNVGQFLVYIFIGLCASYLFSWLSQCYVDLFGETYTAISKLLASTLSLLACLFVIFSANRFSFQLNSRSLGLSLALVIFVSLYIIGPGVRAPITLYITSVSFPYNVNMLAVILLPWLIGTILHHQGD